MHHRSLACLLAAAILGGCANPAPSPTPAPSANPSAATLPSVTGSIPAGGGTIEVPGGPVLAVPAGGLPAGSSVTIAALAGPPGPPPALLGSPVGAVWSVDTGGAALSGPATLTLRFDLAALPAGAGASGLVLAWFDAAAGSWQPAEAVVDLAAGTATATVDHLSAWAVLALPAVAMSLPWPDTGPDGKPLGHTLTGGPHAYWRNAAGAGSYCLPEDPCSLDVPKSVRSGIDFGTGGADWEVRPVGFGTLLFKGSLGQGFGDGVVIDHGGVALVYAHMDGGSLAAAPAPGSAVDRSTVLGRTSCSGMTPCTPTGGAHHLHLELRVGMTASAAGITGWGSRTGWDGRVIGGWTITAEARNYNGSAAACGGKPLPADANGGTILVDASACAGLVLPTPPPGLSGAWAAPAEGATIKAAKVTLSAEAASRLPSAKVAKVTFYVATGSKAPVEACGATKPDAKGAWSCTVADLWRLGAQLGKLTLSFDVFDDAGDLARSPGGSRTVTFAAPPPAPTAVKFAWVDGGDQSCAKFWLKRGVTWCAKGRVAWQAPNDMGTKIYVYVSYAWECFAECPANPIDYCELKTEALYATVSADRKALAVDLPSSGLCWRVAAANAFGKSPKVLAGN